MNSLFIVGKDFYTVSYALAKDDLGSIEAPVKGFYTFESSAHSPLLEEPAAMNKSCERMCSRE